MKYLSMYMRILWVAAILPILAGIFSTITMASVISGRVTIVNSAENEIITIWTDANNVTRTDSLGFFSINGLNDGEYIIFAWAEHSLVTPIDTISIEGDEIVNVDCTIKRYDLNRDSRINLFDAAIIQKHLGEGPEDDEWDEMLDLEPDERIDSLDVLVLSCFWKDQDLADRPTNIIVTEPHFSSVWNLEDASVPITWVTGNLTGPVRIQLIQGGSNVHTISISTENDGYFGDLSVPGQLSPSNDYRVRVHFDDDNFDYSDYFTIDGLEIMQPSGSSIWTTNMQDIPITWMPGMAGETVSIFLLKDDELVDVITTSTENNGYYNGYDMHPEIISGYDYSIKITRDDGISGESDRFEIRNPLRVISPGTDTIWYLGQENREIYWDTGNLGGNVRIILFKSTYNDIPMGLADNITSSTPNDGHFSGYIVPDHFPPSNDYFIIIDMLETTDVSYGETFEILSPYQWIVRETPTSIDLNDVAFIDSRTGAAVGNDGTILRTIDGGVIWETVQSGTDADLMSISFTGDSIGIATGSGGTILKTGNGGSTWQTLISGTNITLSGSTMPDTLHAFAVGDSGIILRTIDGGGSWVVLDSGTDVHLRSVSFAVPDSGMAVGDEGKILKTENGGETWVNIGKGELYPLEYRYCTGVWFTDSRNGTEVGYSGFMESDAGHIRRTTDFGETWTTQKYPSITTVETGVQVRIYDVHYFNNEIGIALGMFNHVLLTTDAGANWTMEQFSASIRSVWMIDPTSPIAVGAGGTIVSRIPLF